jgi:hypothetical protein
MEPITVFLVVLIVGLVIGHLLLFVLGKSSSLGLIADYVKSGNGSVSKNIYPPLSGSHEPESADLYSKNLVLERKLELAHLRLQKMEKELRAMQIAKAEKGEFIDLSGGSEKNRLLKKNKKDK